MTIEEKVFEILAADAAFVARNPSDNILPPGDWQGIEGTYTLHAPVSHRPIETHAGTAALKQWPNYQVSVFAFDYSTARAVADLANTALTASVHPKFFLRNQVSLPYDTDRKRAHIALDYEVWWAPSDEDVDVTWADAASSWEDAPADSTWESPTGLT